MLRFWSRYGGSSASGLAIAFWAVLALGTAVSAQQRSTPLLPTRPPLGPGELRVSLGRPDSPVVRILRTDSLESWIVEFTAPPLLARRGGQVEGGEQPAAQIARFRADLVGVEARVRSLSRPGSVPPAARIDRTFTELLSGVALRATEPVVAAASRLPYVRAVHRDRPIHADLAESVPLIRADQVWAQTGARGEGEVIAILDSGVDYSHPALGGGFGPTFKVMGGYDFVNGDGDPRDDNGHGTHVAAIAAGSGGGITGVAPAARLLAYKILDRGGNGQQSWAIAGLERAADPDQNPATADGAQVVNMSFGSAGDPDDALAHAVDVATGAGLVVVAAAGNDGAYGAIGSPAGARTAVTVGASTKDDHIASFTSRGPTMGEFSLKPDLVAPGVGILSAKLGGGTVAKDGTSMAAPHAAGVAALTRQLHPAWSPALVKAALAETGVDLGGDPFTQGGGRLDALRAVRPPVLALPSSIYLGVVAPEVDLSRQVTLTLYNPGTASATYAVTSAQTPAGVAVGVGTSAVTIAGGDSARVTVAIDVDGATLAHRPQTPFDAGWSLVVQSSAGSVRVPVVAQSGRLYPLSFERPPSVIIVQDRRGNVMLPCMGLCVGTSDMLVFDALLPPWSAPTADVEVLWDGSSADASVTATFVVREGITAPAPGTRLLVREAEATHTVTLRAHDERGAAIPIPGNLTDFAFRYMGSSAFGIFTGSRTAETFRVSSMGRDFHFQWFTPITRGLTLYRLGGTLIGLAGDTVFDNTPADLRHHVVRFEPDSAGRGVYVQPAVANLWVAWTGLWAAYEWGQPAMRLTAPYALDLYRLPPTDDEDYPWDFFLTARDSTTALLRSPYLRMVSADSVRAAVLGTRIVPLYTTPMDTIPVAAWPPTWNGRLGLAGGTLSVSRARGRYTSLFPSQTGDNVFASAHWRLLADGTVLAADSVSAADTTLQPIRTPAPAGAARLEVSSRQVRPNGDPVKATATLDFDVGRGDHEPPTLTRLQFRTGNRFRNAVDPGDRVDVVLEAADDQAVTSARLAIRPPDGDWTDVPLAHPDASWTATLPPAVGSPIDARVDLQDAAGNHLAYQLEPALTGIIAAPVELAADERTFAASDSALRQTYSLTNAQAIVRLGWTIHHLDPLRALEYAGTRLLGRAASLRATATWADSARSITGLIDDPAGVGIAAGAGPLFELRFRLARDASRPRVLAGDTTAFTIVRPTLADAGVRFVQYQVQSIPDSVQAFAAVPMPPGHATAAGRMTLELPNGDLDLDGQVTDADVARVLDAVFDSTRLSPAERLLADLYPDGHLDVLDVVRATRVRLGTPAVDPATGRAPSVSATCAGCGAGSAPRLAISAADGSGTYRVSLTVGAPVAGLQLTLHAAGGAALGAAELASGLSQFRLVRGQGRTPSDVVLLVYSPTNQPLQVGTWPLLTIRAPATAAPPLQASDMRAAGANGRALAMGPATLAGLDQPIPDATTVGQAYPNPFSSARPVHLPIAVGGAGAGQALHFKVGVYGIRGERIRQLQDGDLTPGQHLIDWDGRNEKGALVSSGIYLLLIEGPTGVERRRLVFIR